MTTAFKHVHIFKPTTSKAGNSEVYCVCLGKFPLNNNSPNQSTTHVPTPLTFQSSYESLVQQLVDRQSQAISSNLELFEIQKTDKKCFDHWRRISDEYLDIVFKEWFLQFPISRLKTCHSLANQHMTSKQLGKLTRRRVYSEMTPEVTEKEENTEFYKGQTLLRVPRNSWRNGDLNIQLCLGESIEGLDLKVSAGCSNDVIRKLNQVDPDIWRQNLLRKVDYPKKYYKKIEALIQTSTLPFDDIRPKCLGIFNSNMYSAMSWFSETFQPQEIYMNLINPCQISVNNLHDLIGISMIKESDVLSKFPETHIG